MGKESKIDKAEINKYEIIIFNIIIVTNQYLKHKILVCQSLIK